MIEYGWISSKPYLFSYFYSDLDSNMDSFGYKYKCGCFWMQYEYNHVLNTEIVGHGYHR
jgi:hypothetical protein